MSDVVAEEALLALGPRLEWKSVGLEASPGHVLATLPNGDIYEIQEYTCDHDWNAHFDKHLRKSRSKSPYRYATRDAAKAACERHHTTGEWS